MYDLSNYVKPFKENEVQNVGLANVSSRSLIDKEYFDKASKRLKLHKQQLTLF